MLQIKSKFKRKPSTRKELFDRVKEIMSDHISENNYITKMELFKLIFGNPSQYTEIQIWYLWNHIQKAMNWLRKTSYCFITCKKVADGVYGYFVVKNEKDAQYHHDRLDNSIKKMKWMKKRLDKAVKEEFYKKMSE